MKKLMYIIAGIIITIGMGSCEKKGGIPNNDLDMDVLKGVTVEIPEIGYLASKQISNEGSIPYLIEGKNRGGNRTCEEAQTAFEKISTISLGEIVGDCGEKVDIEDDYEGFVTEFPFEVEILWDGTMRFDTGDPECKVFAVIVKGSNQANVYFYDEGAVSDGGLTPPPLNPGADVLRYPWISNITFCCACVPDEPEDEMFAVKVWYNDIGSCEEGSYALSVGGSYPYENVADWCDVLGFNVYEDTDGTPIALGGVGEIEVVDGDVIITMNDENHIIYGASVYIGDGTDLVFTDCPGYKSDPGWNYESGICERSYKFDVPPLDP